MTKEFKAYLSLGYVSIVWGTTYLVLRSFSIPRISFFGTTPNVSRGLLLIFTFIRSQKNNIKLSYIIHQSIIGLLMITFGNGFVGYAEMLYPAA